MAKYDLIRVVSIKKLKEPVFTVDVEVGGANGSHSYQLNNGIVSHNTVSLLGGSTPGIHYPISKIYIRRLRFNKTSPILDLCISAGLKVEPCIGSEHTTVVVEFPVIIDENIPTSSEVSIEEKFEMLALLQDYWSDNQISVTIDFDKDTEGNKIKGLIEKYINKLKSLSFLPRSTSEKLPFPQMPYEEITKEQYDEIMKNVNLSKLYEKNTKGEEHEIESDIFCDGDKCYKV